MSAQPARVDEAEIWLRHMLFESEITRTGTLHPKFFENNFKKPTFIAPWVLGMSGRIFSKTGGNVKDFAERVIKQKKLHARFRGVIAQQVRQIRRIDPVYDVSLAKSRGSDADPAHADLTRKTDWVRIDGEIAHEQVKALNEGFEVLPNGSAKLNKFLSSGQLPTKA